MIGIGVVTLFEIPFETPFETPFRWAGRVE